MAKRAVVIGLDGAAWHLLDPLIDNGHMKNLASLRDRGAAGVLKSTVPTYTPPAWTSAITGVNPGRHGVYGFHAGNAQSERQELMHSGRIKVSTIWEMVNAQGVRAGIFNLPLTYPPQKLDGWMVSGMMTPSYGHHLRGFVFPNELEERVLSWAPDYEVEIKTSWEEDWRDASLCDRAIRSLEQRSVVLQSLLEQEPVDVVFSVIETPDRLQHAYYRFMDPQDPFHQTEAAARLRPFIARCFEAIDRIVGMLADYAGPDGGVIVCSDHGFTAWEMSVHTNALLQKWGYLKLKPGTQFMQSRLARAAVPVAKRLLPAKVARRAKGRTFAAVDWSKTRAFASPIPQQGIFINMAGREREGIVPQHEVEALKDELTARLKDLRGPEGRPITDQVWRSEEVFHGDALDGAPDLLPVMKDYRFELDDEIFHKSPFTDHSHLPRGAHHPDGMIVVMAPGVSNGIRVSGSVIDVTPTLLYLAGMSIPEGLDGNLLSEAFRPDHLDDQPPRSTRPLEPKSTHEESPYSEEEAAIIEESLRGLGYL